MKFTLVKPDGVICVDGACLNGFDLSGLSANVHSVQWFEDHGEIESTDPATRRTEVQPFTDMQPYTQYIEAYQAKKKAIEDAKHVAEAELLRLANAN